MLFLQNYLRTTITNQSPINQNQSPIKKMSHTYLQDLSFRELQDITSIPILKTYPAILFRSLISNNGVAFITISSQENSKQFWLNNSGRTWPKVCQIHNCGKTAIIGAHIRVKHIRQTLILPSCRQCSMDSEIQYGKCWANAKQNALAVYFKDNTKSKTKTTIETEITIETTTTLKTKTTLKK